MEINTEKYVNSISLTWSNIDLIALRIGWARRSRSQYWILLGISYKPYFHATHRADYHNALATQRSLCIPISGLSRGSTRLYNDHSYSRHNNNRTGSTIFDLAQKKETKKNLNNYVTTTHYLRITFRMPLSHPRWIHRPQPQYRLRLGISTQHHLHPTGRSNHHTYFSTQTLLRISIMGMSRFHTRPTHRICDRSNRPSCPRSVSYNLARLSPAH